MLTRLVRFGLALLLSLVGGWVVAGRLLRPVRLVHEAAEEITEQDLTRRIDVGDDAEVVYSTEDAAIADERRR